MYGTMICCDCYEVWTDRNVRFWLIWMHRVYRLHFLQTEMNNILYNVYDV